MSLWKNASLIGWATVVLVMMSACSDLPTRRERSRKASSTVARTRWLNVLPTAMSNEFCSSDGELLRCYSQLSNDECHQRVKQITVNCEAAYSNAIPDHLGKSDTQVWGGAIGDCAKEGVLQLIQTQSLVPVSEACRQTVLDM